MKSNVEVESAKEAAQRLGVTVRAVQKWASEGKIPGAEKLGRQWFIPKDFEIDGEKKSEQKKSEKKEACSEGYNSEIDGIPGVYQLKNFRSVVPFLNSSYEPGKSREYIESIKDEDDRNIALAEYYYYSGNEEKALELFEPYMDSRDPALRFSANLMGFFANMSLSQVHFAEFSMRMLFEQIQKGRSSDAPEYLHAIASFTMASVSVVNHVPLPEILPLEDCIKFLPEGFKLWAFYILAHKANNDKDYSRALAFADAGLLMSNKLYPVAYVYVQIMAAVSLMELRRTEEAKKRLAKAWEVAEPDGLIQPFAVHHALLQGLLEAEFKRNNPEVFERIIKITKRFMSGWIKIHRALTKKQMPEELTTTEFTVAMLYTRGWTTKEIAAHIDVSNRTVQNYISSIYQKLGITKKAELSYFVHH